LIPLAQIYLLSAVVTLIVGILIYGQNPAHAVNRMFLVVCGLLFYYEFTGGFEFLQSVDVNAAFGWLRLGAFWYLLPVAVLHICMVYSNLRIRKFILFLMYGSAIVFSVLEAIATPYEVYRVPWGWAAPYTGYYAYVQVFWVALPSILALLVLIKRYQAARSQEEKIGLSYVFSGVLLPVVTGIAVTALPYVTPEVVPDLTPPAAAMGVLLVGYAVYRYGRQLLTAGAATNDILSTMVDAVFLCDPEGKIIVTNNAASRLLEYETRELDTRPLNTIIRDYEASRTILEGNVPLTLETGLVTKRGVLIPVSISRSAVLTKRGSVAGYVLICRDITERKRMEERLAEAQRLAAIGETAAMVGHDLRNPLQTLMGTLGLVKQLVTSEDAEGMKEARDLLGSLRDTVQYMDKIVSDLQDYARPVGADPVESNLMDLVQSSIADVIVPESVEVAVDIRASSNVKVDRVLLRRVLTNLILNAVQAMPNGGKLTISGGTENRLVTIAVQDTGVGIAQENIQKIFTPFFTTKAQGQGLGLAVCRRFMDVQGGTIDVESKVGKGTTFTIKVPI
jgi:PAS domain S-box-containing protein